MGIDILHNLLVFRRDITRDIKVEIVALYLLITNQTRIVRHIFMRTPSIYNTTDVLLTQPVLGAVFHETVFGINHVDTLRRSRLRFVDDDQTRRDTCSEEDIARQTDDAGDDMALDEIPADVRFGITTEEHAVRKDTCRLAVRLKRADDMQQKSVVTTSVRRNRSQACHITPTAVRVVLIGGSHPAFLGERRIGNHIVELHQLGVVDLMLRVIECVALEKFRIRDAVNDHRHTRHTDGRVVELLSFKRHFALRLGTCSQQQRTGTACRVIDRDMLACIFGDSHHFSHHTTHLGRGVELPFALARLGSEVPHQVLVRVTYQVIVCGTVVREIEVLVLKDSNQAAQRLDLVFVLSQFLVIIEIGIGDDTLQVVRVRQFADDRVHRIANTGFVLQLHHVGKTATLRQINH